MDKLSAPLIRLIKKGFFLDASSLACPLPCFGWRRCHDTGSQLAWWGGLWNWWQGSRRSSHPLRWSSAQRWRRSCLPFQWRAPAPVALRVQCGETGSKKKFETKHIFKNVELNNTVYHFNIIINSSSSNNIKRWTQKGLVLTVKTPLWIFNLIGVAESSVKDSSDG